MVAIHGKEGIWGCWQRWVLVGKKVGDVLKGGSQPNLRDYISNRRRCDRSRKSILVFSRHNQKWHVGCLQLSKLL